MINKWCRKSTKYYENLWKQGLTLSGVESGKSSSEIILKDKSELEINLIEKGVWIWGSGWKASPLGEQTSMAEESKQGKNGDGLGEGVKKQSVINIL